MTVVTISRQYGSRGDEIANRVCEILGLRIFDKRLITQVARDVGLTEQEVMDYSEENFKIRSFLDRLLGRAQPIEKTRLWKEDPMGNRFVEESRLTEEAVVSLVQKAILNAHHIGNMVIVGRGGQIILRDYQDVLHIRIEAPLEDRIQTVKQQLKQSTADYSAHIDIRRDAQNIILQKDSASQDYIRRFYHMDWDNPILYHMVLNTGKLTIEQASHVIVELARSTQIIPRTEEPVHSPLSS
jgi:cytidylate kinase